jgi:hypothetical protein
MLAWAAPQALCSVTLALLLGFGITKALTRQQMLTSSRSYCHKH